MKILVDPPSSEARRERVERQLFAQLAAVRLADRADAVIPRAGRSRATYALAFAGLAAAALAIVLLVSRDDKASEPIASAPSRIVTPVGGESRVTIEGAIIDAKSDTSVEVKYGANGATTLVLARGTVDCHVLPRGSRPPFRVIPGDVAVEVVGTRFTVARTPAAARVDVAHGTVRVTAPGGTWLVEAGESWPVTTAAVPPVPVPVPVPEAGPRASDLGSRAPERDDEPAVKKPAVDLKPTAPTPTERDLARKSLRLATQLEVTDPAKAAQLYRAIATESKDLAATALISLAALQLEEKEPAAALATVDEHVRRFPQTTTAEDAAWLRYKALLALGKRDEARGAAADYLRQFPGGTYAERLRTR